MTVAFLAHRPPPRYLWLILLGAGAIPLRRHYFARRSPTLYRNGMDALARTAVDPLSAILGSTLATVLMLGFALAYARLSAAARQAHIERTAKLEARLDSARLDNVVTYDVLGAKLGDLHDKANAISTRVAILEDRGNR